MADTSVPDTNTERVLAGASEKWKKIETAIVERRKAGASYRELSAEFKLNPDFIRAVCRATTTTSQF